MNDHLQVDMKRLEVLNAFRILDTPAEPIFDRLAQFAATISNTPIATITLIDENRPRFKSVIGLDISQTERAISFCAHTIRRFEPLVINDTLHDPMFCDNPLVTGPPYLRFYAGIPLISFNGFAIGTLAVMDRVPRRLNKTRIDVLKMLAEQVMTHIDLRLQRIEMNNALAVRDEINAILDRQTEHLRDAQRIAKIGSWVLELPSRKLRLSE